MSQLNMHVTPDFEDDLARLMELRGIPTKSAAIREAVAETLDRARRAKVRKIDFRDWIGAAREAALDPEPRFASDDDLWKVAESES